MAIDVIRVNSTIVIVTKDYTVTQSILSRAMFKASRQAIIEYSLSNPNTQPPFEALIPIFIIKLKRLLNEACDELERLDEVTSTTD